MTRRERLRLYDKLGRIDRTIDFISAMVARGETDCPGEIFTEGRRRLAAAYRLRRMYINHLTYEQLPLFTEAHE
jgi:hypothetical protein